MRRRVHDRESSDASDVPLAAAISVPLWLIAGFAALALHAGSVAFAAYYLKPEPVDDELGAPAVEVGIEYAAPHLEPLDLPPGPEAEDSAASPAVVEQKANVEETQLPKEQPLESDDPDRLVSPDDSTKPKEDDPTIKAMEAMPSTESIASEATAPPVSETAQESVWSTAPVQGTGESDQRVRVTWEKELAVHLNKHKRYPANGRRRNVQVLVRFTIDRLGHVLAASVVTGSGDASFDEAALDMLHRSDPVPPPPPLVADEGLSFTLPVIFRVRGGG